MTTILAEETYAKLDPEICELVKSLNLCGVRTTASCQGHTDKEKTPHPWVLIDVDNTIFARITKLSVAVAKYNVSQNDSCRWAILSFSGKNARSKTRTMAYLEPETKNAARDERQLNIFQESAIRLGRSLSEKYGRCQRAD